MKKDGTDNKPSEYIKSNGRNFALPDREDNDYYATDPKAIELLLHEERFAHDVWECACGEGHLAKVLTAHGYRVVPTDLIDRGFGRGGIDFLKWETPFPGDIITNPPYKYAQEFVEHALELIHPGNKVAMFLKIQFLEGKARRKLFDAAPPRTIYISTSRLRCAKNGEFDKYRSTAPCCCYAWFIWEKGYTGAPEIKWFN